MCGCVCGYNTGVGVYCVIGVGGVTVYADIVVVGIVSVSGVGVGGMFADVYNGVYCRRLCWCSCCVY